MRRASAIYLLLTLAVAAAALAWRAAPVAIEGDLARAPEMETLYEQNNKAYFSGRLPHARVFWSRDVLDEEGLMGLTVAPGHGVFIIMLDRKMLDDGFERTAQQTLLHESCHLKLWPYTRHGPRFQRCMMSLAEKGAMSRLW
jgi:hypothetical protein